ncbi:MAG TPA: UvrB/UvrC motif-containing protein [Planctomycetota bacterium]|nr:UvrB/UvrC motif-containing protein [Planctomycetota bacterium]HUV39759.1 UvrB/UvrC motif-containing protein [Planctomycetota bacterium]
MPPIICQICKKNVATVHLTEIIKSQKREIHLCEECAGKKGVAFKSHQFSITDLLSGLVNSQAAQELAKMSQIKCPICGLSYLDFRQHGRLGCATDYTVFKEGLLPLLEKIHGGTEHMGKIPQSSGDAREVSHRLLELRQELKRAVEREDYEQAAELRDRIQAVEEGRDEDA